ncbi:ThiF family adenylyltransferase [Chroococcidiopsis thermalis]|uniref:UBA/THIF-type NAD/FAD binding protein n=1 Tax=Chroococcidiopsis thermalis (strain PCC 7203) TaxID=251229 RepID=K9U9Y7_CHRTP|nr:ThiF family adenylyltransferase [Chroococcidiopsis thermalis]AFY91236.1 UBA/THIF-type NAD/FAD binding protein [Chroococcidiopsis thermalis PCC 7203]
MTIDLSFANSVPIIPAQNTQIQFVLVGAGGTGSCIIRELCKVVCQIQSVTKKQVSIRIVDFDTVESRNIPRQIFLPEEIGMNKAEALAIRYSSAFGISIKAIDQPFDCQMVNKLKQWNTLTVIIGCVDNAAARAEIERCLEYNSNTRSASLFWLDCGNAQTSGQVLLGTTTNFDLLRAFDRPERPNLCYQLPSPTSIHPELLVVQPEELSSSRLSCASILLRNYQALFVNQFAATIASQYILELTFTGGLRRFATYFDCKTMSCKSLYITPSNLSQFQN